jgi:hypothetical protein
MSRLANRLIKLHENDSKDRALLARIRNGSYFDSREDRDVVIEIARFYDEAASSLTDAEIYKYAVKYLKEFGKLPKQ